LVVCYHVLDMIVNGQFAAASLTTTDRLENALPFASSDNSFIETVHLQGPELRHARC